MTDGLTSCLYARGGRYTEGLEYEKPNIALNANAAMASIKMGCFVQAIEHADKAVRICDFLLEKPKHPIKVRMASERRP